MILRLRNSVFISSIILVFFFGLLFAFLLRFSDDFHFFCFSGTLLQMKSVFFQRGAFVSEPAILVKRINMGSQVWSMEKLENKLVDMRDMYEERKYSNTSQRLPAVKVKSVSSFKKKKYIFKRILTSLI